jgi:hypothetical protein
MKLEDIRAAAEKKYGSFPIELSEDSTVTLLNPLRLSKASRKKLLSFQETANDEDAEQDQEDMIEDMLRLVCESEKAGDLLIAAVDGDLAVMMSIFEEYQETVSLGEASASES